MRGLVLAAVGIAASAASLWLIARSMDLPAAERAVRAADVSPLLATLAIVTSQLVLRSVRWQLLLPRRADGARVPVRVVAPSLLVGYLGNAVLPARLGEPIRAFLVSRREGLHGSEAFGSVVIERVVDLATLAGIAFLAAISLDAPEWLVRIAGIAALGGATVVFVLSTTGIVRLVPLLARPLAVFGAQRRHWLETRLERFAVGSAGAHRRPAVLAAAGISCGTWLLEGATFRLVAQSVAIDLTWPAALLIAAVTVLGTAVPSAPAFVGTYEVAVISAATALGVPGSQALALAVLAHVFTTLPLAVAGAVSLAAIGGGGVGSLSSLSRLASAARREPAAAERD